jgi:hypothetical protein
MNHAELLEKLKKLDEVLLLELLELTSEDIVDQFLDKIKEKETYIRHEVEEL